MRWRLSPGPARGARLRAGAAGGSAGTPMGTSCPAPGHRAGARRGRSRRALGAAAAAVWLACLGAPAMAAPAAAGAAVRVAVWPQGPGDDVAGVDAAVRGAGFEPAPIDRLRERLRAQGEREAALEAAALDALQAALAAARESYLRQDFVAMAAVLAQAEAAALPVLAQPRHAAVLWELELQRGLAALRQGQLEDARARFAFALALDEGRAPRRDLYGPEVTRTFAEIADARAAIPPRPTPLRIEPRDARVAIDGLPVIDNAAPRALRPGLHVIAAAAPGYRGHAAIVEVRSGAAIELALVPAAGDAVERLGGAWAAGAVDAGTESGRRAIAAAIAELGAAAAVIIDVDRARGDAGARVIVAGAPDGGGAGRAAVEASAVERRATAAAAAAAALAHLAADGTLRREVAGGAGFGGAGRRSRSGSDGAGGAGGARGSRGSVLRSWWLWTALGAVTVAVGTGLAIDSMRDRTIRILPPAPRILPPAPRILPPAP